MAKRELKPVRGVFERPKGSDVWWINYYVEGSQHREKVGARGAAIDLYKIRKADALRGAKLPDLKRGKITLSSLIDDLLEFVAHHNDLRNYVSKAKKVRKTLGSRPAADLTPQEIERWLRSNTKTPATSNRYKAFFSLAYREGIRNGKVSANPAHLVRHRREPQGRLRFLSKEEYDKLHAVIAKRYPEHLAEFVVSVHSGMRLSEQYTCDWSQVHLGRRAIDLTKTKNGYSRIVNLNADSIAAIDSLRRTRQRPTDRLFPREVKKMKKGSKDNFDTRSWFAPCLAEAGIDGYLWHGNRHTFCSWLAMKGATEREIMDAAGHRSTAMAARYSHLSPAHTQSVVDRIAST